VGLISFGGHLSWIGPGQGQRHVHRLMDLLVSSPFGWEPAAALTRLPRAALPPGALIIVFSPLLDTRLIEAVRDLRERGFSVLVVDVLNTEPRHDQSIVSGLAARMWRLEQEAIRFSLTQIGVPVVHWNGGAWTSRSPRTRAGSWWCAGDRPRAAGSRRLLTRAHAHSDRRADRRADHLGRRARLA
jgi:uncharacterized protein (DUF58 family)